MAAKCAQLHQVDCGAAVFLIAAFFLNALSCGISYSFGLYYITFIEVFQEGSTLTSWIGSINFAAFCASGPLVSYIGDKIGIRATILLGALISTSGFIVTAFAMNIYVVIVFLGLITGIGYGMVFTMVTVAVALRFDKHRPLALVISQAGISIGSFVYPMVGEYLLDFYGWRGTMLLTAGFTLNMMVAGCLVAATTGKADSTPKDRDRSRLWWNWKYWIMITVCFFLYFGHIAYCNHVGAYAESIGHSKTKSVRLISLLAIMGLVFRSSLSLLISLRWVDIYCFFAFMTLLPGLSDFLMTLWSSYNVTVASTVLHSTLYSALGPVMLEILMMIVGAENFSLGYACLEVPMALGALTGPPAAGFVYEVTGAYENALYLTGSTLIAAALCSLTLVLGKQKTTLTIIDEKECDGIVV